MVQWAATKPQGAGRFQALLCLSIPNKEEMKMNSHSHIGSLMRGDSHLRQVLSLYRNLGRPADRAIICCTARGGGQSEADEVML